MCVVSDVTSMGPADQILQPGDRILKVWFHYHNKHLSESSDENYEGAEIPSLIIFRPVEDYTGARNM